MTSDKLCQIITASNPVVIEAENIACLQCYCFVSSLLYAAVVFKPISIYSLGEPPHSESIGNTRANRRQKQRRSKSKAKTKQKQSKNEAKAKQKQSKGKAKAKLTAILEQFWSDLGPSWLNLPILGLSWTILEQCSRFLGPFMCILGSSWGRLGPFWGHVGPS